MRKAALAAHRARAVHAVAGPHAALLLRGDGAAHTTAVGLWQ